jgi:hypothetical protein
MVSIEKQTGFDAPENGCASDPVEVPGELYDYARRIEIVRSWEKIITKSARCNT